MNYGLYNLAYITSDLSALSKIFNMFKKRLHCYGFFFLCFGGDFTSHGNKIKLIGAREIACG